jgi:hypothetical protein
VQNPFSMSVAPFKTVAAAGQRSLTYPVTIKDTGSAPLKVTSSIAQLAQSGSTCGLAKAPSWVTVSPGTLTLQPGQSAQAMVHVAAPAAAAGRFDLAAIFASAGTGQGTVQVSGAVGSRLLLNLPGKSAVKDCLAAAPPATHQGSPLLGAILVGVLGVLAVALVLWLRHLLRNRRSHRAQPPARHRAEGFLPQPPALADIDPDELARAMKITPEAARDLIASAAARSPGS